MNLTREKRLENTLQILTEVGITSIDELYLPENGSVLWEVHDALESFLYTTVLCVSNLKPLANGMYGIEDYRAEAIEHIFTSPDASYHLFEKPVELAINSLKRIAKNKVVDIFRKNMAVKRIKNYVSLDAKVDSSDDACELKDFIPDQFDIEAKVVGELWSSDFVLSTMRKFKKNPKKALGFIALLLDLHPRVLREMIDEYGYSSISILADSVEDAFGIPRYALQNLLAEMSIKDETVDSYSTDCISHSKNDTKREARGLLQKY